MRTVSRTSSNSNGSSSKQSSSKSPYRYLGLLLSHLAVSIVSYQFGVLSHFNHNLVSDTVGLNNLLIKSFTLSNGKNNECDCSNSQYGNPDGSDNTKDDTRRQAQQQIIDPDLQDVLANATIDTTLSPKMNRLFMGAARVSRSSFISHYDLGVPWNMNNKTYFQEVLMLYPHPESFPTSNRSVTHEPDVFPNVHFASATEATEQCEDMKVVLMLPEYGSCVAIVPQWESHVVYNFLRWKDDKYLHDSRAPLVSKQYSLKHVSRFHTRKGDRDARLPSVNEMNYYRRMLFDYLDKLDSTLERLRPILEEMTTKYNEAQEAAGQHHRRRRRHTNPVVVVMVCNFGQSELFLNFICSAKSRGLDLSRILLFATDKDMYDLASTVDEISVFEVADAFGGENVIPRAAAKTYGDTVFTGMMFSKVYCVHLVNHLGYDVLFQDVDIVWYKNPIEYFENTDKSGLFDFYFQDDGARSNRYAPYSPNSGFYYVRYNRKTLYFFSLFMRMGDSIMVSKSHQAVLNTLLVEHSSTKGLKIKVFERDSQLGLAFPGGYHYHYRRSWVKEFVLGQHEPYLFHMSWTKNKDNKINFFQQMGDWFVHDHCINKVASDIPDITTDFYNACCSAEMLFKCHYSDKPSKKSCRGSPKIDKRGRPFWLK